MEYHEGHQHEQQQHKQQQQQQQRQQIQLEWYDYYHHQQQQQQSQPQKSQRLRQPFELQEGLGEGRHDQHHHQKQLQQQQRKQRFLSSDSSVIFDDYSMLLHKTSHCPNDCGPTGDCVVVDATNTSTLYRCRCHSNTSGSDCSIPTTYCPGYLAEPIRRYNINTTMCYNGGTCERIDDATYASTVADYGTGYNHRHHHREQQQQQRRRGGGGVENSSTEGIDLDTVYRCRCNDNDNDSTGSQQCETAAESVSCEIGNENSNYAYCLNGGTCRMMVTSVQQHVPCECPRTEDDTSTGYEGRHCQYERNTQPEGEYKYTVAVLAMYTQYVLLSERAKEQHEQQQQRRRKLYFKILYSLLVCLLFSWRWTTYC
jgi:hypothetical protein